MTHPIVVLQGALVAALEADAELAGMLGAGGVFDAPPSGRQAPYLVIARHDVLSRDGDEAPGHEHRLLFHAWAGEASRRAVLAIAERVVEVALGAALDGAGLRVTHRVHERTDTAVDLKSGQARAAVALRMMSEG